VLFALPYAALAMGGVLLWRRVHSAATMMIALGFAAAFLGRFVELLSVAELNTIMQAHPDSTFFLVSHHAFPRLIRYVGLLGLWTGSAGLIWHATMPSIPASADHRRTDP